MRRDEVMFSLLVGFVWFTWLMVSQAEESLKLEEVVVTATKTPHLLKDVPVETVVITKDDIDQSTAQTVTDLLRYVPGIFVRSEDAPGISAWRTRIRGLDFNSGYGLVLVDGQRVKGGGMGEAGYGLNQVPLGMIERIEIVRGPGSALYGSDALAGVVNIITKSTPDRTIYGVRTAYGTHQTKLGSLYWGTKVNSLGMFLQVSREDSKMGQYGYRKNRDERYTRNRVDAKFSYLRGNIEFSLQLAGEERKRRRKYLTKDTVRYSDDFKIRLSPALKVTFEDKANLQVRGYYYDWDFKTEEYGKPSGFTPRIGDMYYKDLELRYSKPLPMGNLMTLGAEYLREELDYNLAEKKISVMSFYLQNETKFSVWRPLSVVIGGRLDHHSTYGTELCPKLSLMWELTDRTMVRASVGRGFKSPTVRQLHYKEPFQHGRYWIKSNPNLKPEKSWGYSVGVERVMQKKIILSGTLFRNDLKDKVVRVETEETIDELPVRSYKNIGKAYTQGMEVGLRAAVFDWLSANLSYTYLDTQDKETGKELTYCPRHNFAAQLSYRFKPLGFSLNFGGQYVSEMYKDTRNTKKTEGYWLFDVKFIKKLSKFAYLSLEGNNIFGSDYGEPKRDWWGPTWLLQLRMEF